MSKNLLIDLRHRLHRCAEVSNDERETAELLAAELRATQPDELIEQIGGHGLAAVYAGAEPGPTVLLRSDTDALPIPDDPQLAYSAARAGVSHKCGHDGHMAMLVGVARKLGEARPGRGRVVTLFQPAEETGEGAARVLRDPRVQALEPQRALALHNLPGHPLGSVVVRGGPFASASKGLIIELTGVSSHAAEPYAGVSPVAAAASIVQALQAAPQRISALHESLQVTVVGIDVGGRAFGTSPGSGRVYATLRAHTEASMEKLTACCVGLARGLAAAHSLECSIDWTDVFPATENDPEIVEVVVRAAQSCEIDVRRADVPFAWSEDFGHFTAAMPAALFGLGSGTEQPTLHHPDYDFPDALLTVGVSVFTACLPDLLRDTLPNS